MKTIVFVCTGNTCRSPMAEGLFRVLAEKYALRDVECTSCGLSAFTGMPVTDYAVKAAAEYGADISAHRSRPLTEYLLLQGDLFVCMTSRHADLLAPYLPAEKLRVLGDGIPDPFGGTQEDYKTCAAAIYAALETMIQKDLEDKS